MNPAPVATARKKPDLEEPRSRPGKPRVLHVLGSLTIGGVETWLMHMLRQRERFGVEQEILLTKDEVGLYEDDARRMGVAIHKLPIS